MVTSWTASWEGPKGIDEKSNLTHKEPLTRLRHKAGGTPLSR